MKFLLILMLQIVIVFSHAAVFDPVTFQCKTGTVIAGPTKILDCPNANEEFACAYNEQNCHGLSFCATGPCHWG